MRAAGRDRDDVRMVACTWTARFINNKLRRRVGSQESVAVGSTVLLLVLGTLHKQFLKARWGRVVQRVHKTEEREKKQKQACAQHHVLEDSHEGLTDNAGINEVSYLS